MRDWTSPLFQDVRYAVRILRRSRAFTAMAVLSLALGIGANTAIFSLVDTLMLRRLPVRDPGQLVELLHRFPGEPHFNGFSWEAYQYYLGHNQVFSALIGDVRSPDPRGSAFQVQVAEPEPETVNGVYVTGNFFPVLGVRTALGRLLTPEDDRLGSPAAVAVVSWSWWKNRYNLDPAILGKRIVVDHQPVTIVGVAERGFTGWRVELPQDLWLPLALQPVLHPDNNFLRSRGGDLSLVGRLKPGISLEQARAEMAILYRETVAENTTGGARFLRVMRFEMEPAGSGLSGLRDQFDTPLLVLMAVVALLLLLACVNLASLLLARAAARQREMALRVSLGAGRLRLVRQMWTESLLLSCAGALLGVWLAYLGTRALLRIMASGRVRIDLQVHPDLRVLLFTAGLALLTGLLFGLAPAWRAWSTAPAAVLRDPGHGGDTCWRRLFAKGLVAVQVAFSVVLLAAAGLFLSQLAGVYSNLGFERDRVLLVSLDPARGGYRRDQLAGPYRELLDRLQRIPGVGSATLSAVTPVQGAGANRDPNVEGYQPRPGELRYVVENWVAPRYFETLGMPLLMGRDFTFADESRSRVAIINQTMARYFFGNASPLGKYVWFDDERHPYEIVGVVADAKYLDAREATPRTIFFNAFQDAQMFSQFSLRTTVPPVSIAGPVRSAVRDVLKTVPVRSITTLAEQVDADIVPERLIVRLSGWFGVLGSLLAAIGIYGLLAYTVARRGNEIGIRIALGATRARVIRNVLAESLGTAVCGLLVGVLLALWTRKLLASVIPGLPAAGWQLLASGGAAIIGIALLAAIGPARRASRVDPMEALRYQ